VASARAVGERTTSLRQEDVGMKSTLQIAGCAFGVLLASACNSVGTNASQTPSSSVGPVVSASDAAVTAPGAAGIATAQNPAGPILTDARGHALYLFEADKGSTSTCSGACAKEWPPLTTAGAPIAGTGVNTALVATSPRADGTTQVTYNGHPLYFYDDDDNPGMTKGQGENSFGAKWYLLTPAGLKIDDD
jgi:predicted lipoprotein with Yx(FWY)xxD motif